MCTEPSYSNKIEQTIVFTTGISNRPLSSHQDVAAPPKTASIATKLKAAHPRQPTLNDAAAAAAQHSNNYYYHPY